MGFQEVVAAVEIALSTFAVVAFGLVVAALVGIVVMHDDEMDCWG